MSPAISAVVGAGGGIVVRGVARPVGRGVTPILVMAMINSGVRRSVEWRAGARWDMLMRVVRRSHYRGGERGRNWDWCAHGLGDSIGHSVCRMRRVTTTPEL